MACPTEALSGSLCSTVGKDRVLADDAARILHARDVFTRTLLQALKAELDPRCLMNPGALEL
jgi:hypothetical protein